MLRKLFRLVFLLVPVTVLYSVSLSQSNSWRGIRPLYSSRIDVEKILGKPSGECNCIYKTANEAVKVSYATSNCEGDTYGWNVPKDTVLYFSVDSDQKRAIGELPNNGFIKIYSHGIMSNIDSTSGMVYEINYNEGIDNVAYFPTQRDSSKRCNGFPPFDLVSLNYEPFGKYDLQHQQKLENGLDNIILNAMETPNFVGYIIFYGSKATSVSEWMKINNYINKRIGNLDNIKIINGGCRKSAEIEIFFISKELPSVIPTPTIICQNT